MNVKVLLFLSFFVVCVIILYIVFLFKVILLCDLIVLVNVWISVMKFWLFILFLVIVDILIKLKLYSGFDVFLIFDINVILVDLNNDCIELLLSLFLRLLNLWIMLILWLLLLIVWFNLVNLDLCFLNVFFKFNKCVFILFIFICVIL